MRQLLDNLKRHLHWVVFLLLEVVSLVLLFRFNPYQESVWFSRANQVSASINEVKHQLTAYLNLRQENRQLTQENIFLQHRLEQMRRLLQKVPTDTAVSRHLLSLEQAGMRMIPARICDNSIRQRDNMILINRGAQDGVRSEMGVVCGTGVVGIVAQVGPKHSTVLPVLNSKSSISCRIRGSNYFGYLRWQGGSPMKAQLTDVPHHAKVRIGDVVETSGFSNIFPAGIFVGRVMRIKNSNDGLAYQLDIQLSADLSNTQEVVVIERKEIILE